MIKVATVPTVYGIETKLTLGRNITKLYRVATVPTVYGIETVAIFGNPSGRLLVATVPTVYGIETTVVRIIDLIDIIVRCNSTYRLRY